LPRASVPLIPIKLLSFHASIEKKYGFPFAAAVHSGSVLNLVEVFKDLEIGLLNLASSLPLMRFIGAYPIFEHPLTELLIAECLWVVLPKGVY